MGKAVVRTVTDPETGEDIELMVFNNRGKLSYQRLHPPHQTERYYDHLATFGEVASRAYGQRKTGFLPPAAERVAQEIPRMSRASPGETRRQRMKELQQQRYRELLGEAIPEMTEELILRQAVNVPSLQLASREDATELERQLRSRLAVARVPIFR